VAQGPANILTAAVWPTVDAADWGGPRLPEDLRLLRASLLYADRVELIITLSGLLALRLVVPHPGIYFKSFVRWELLTELLADHFGLPNAAERADAFRAVCPSADIVERAASEIKAVYEAGALTLPIGLEREGFVADARVAYGEEWADDPNVVPALSARTRWPSRALEEVIPRRQWEGALATTLASDVDCFPDASIDVLLDVRERITGARVHFTAAVAQAATELTDADPPDERLEMVVNDVRRRVIEPALDDLRESLTALGARRTLLRLASNRVTTAGAGASLALAAGAGGPLAGLRTLVQGAVAAPIVAAAAEELNFRLEVKQALRLQPYWLLREAAAHIRPS
jgi:hypothetical protein